MKRRKIIAALLALSCTMSMAVPAFAADTETMPATSAALETQDADALATYALDVDTTLQKPTLKVTLPASTAVLVNPYRMEVDIGGGATSFDTILSPEMEVENLSACAIRVDVKGSLATKQKLASDAYATTTALTNVSGMVDGTDFSLAANPIYLANDGKTYVDANGHVLTVKATTDKAAGTTSYAVSAYVASKDIKVATAPVKDIDADKSNTLFIYVEGKQDGGSWASTFDSKATAGVKDSKTGVMSTTGMMALAAKEASKSILYLNAGDKGQVRVSGQASTNPTKAWTAVTDEFATPFTFVIDAVANTAPAAPLASDITFGKVTGIDFADTTSYTKGAISLATGANIAARTDSVTVTAPAGASTKVTVTGDATLDGTSDVVFNATNGGKATIVVELTQYGMTTTYTFEVEISVS